MLFFFYSSLSLPFSGCHRFQSKRWGCPTTEFPATSKKEELTPPPHPIPLRSGQIKFHGCRSPLRQETAVFSPSLAACAQASIRVARPWEELLFYRWPRAGLLCGWWPAPPRPSHRLSGRVALRWLWWGGCGIRGRSGSGKWETRP
jgi:hypothetical protein